MLPVWFVTQVGALQNGFAGRGEGRSGLTTVGEDRILAGTTEGWPPQIGAERLSRSRPLR